MKTKRILAALLSFVLVGQITPVFAEEVSNNTEIQATVTAEKTLNVSSVFTEKYKSDFSVSEVDYSLFDKFTKYSLMIPDQSVLTSEQLELCKQIFELERTYMTSSCVYGREVLKREAAPKRLSVNDKKTIADIVNSAYSNSYRLYELTSDIEYSYNRGLGDQSSCVEYWLDDNGKEKIIYFSDPVTVFYEKTYDEKPDLFEEDNIMEICTGGNVHLTECEDGTYKYTGNIIADEFKETPVLTSDIWNYELMDDGSALIVGCTLPVYDEAELITETTVLPKEIDGHTVYGIHDALKGTGITGLEIPDNYKYVHVSGMENLEKITVDSPELILGKSSITGCPNLSEVSLNVYSVENNAVWGCENLKNLVITGAKGISYDAFANLPELSEVTLSEGLIYIGQDAFKNTAVKELKIPNSVEIMGVIKNPYVSHDGAINDPLTDDCVLIADEDCEIICEANMEVQNYLAAKEIKYGSAKNAELGDVNADGKVDLTDLTELSLAIIGDKTLTESQIKAADIDENGKADLPDLARLRQYLSKVVTSLKNTTDTIIQYDAFSRDYPYYNTISELTNQANQVFSGRITNIYFELLNMKNMKPIKDGDDSQWAMIFTVYEIEVTDVYKGSPTSVKLRIEGGIPSCLEQEQIELLGNDRIPVMKDIPCLTIGENYTFVLFHADESEYSSILNPQQSVYSESSINTHGFSSFDIISYFSK